LEQNEKQIWCIFGITELIWLQNVVNENSIFQVEVQYAELFNFLLPPNFQKTFFSYFFLGLSALRFILCWQPWLF